MDIYYSDKIFKIENSIIDIEKINSEKEITINSKIPEKFIYLLKFNLKFNNYLLYRKFTFTA